MPSAPVPPEVDRFLREPNPAVMASPRTSAWVRVDPWHGWVGSRPFRDDDRLVG